MNSEPNLYWSQMGTRVRENRRKTVRDHILLGDHFFGHFPLAIPPGGLARHLQTFGGSGFGKTVVASQLTEQVMDAGEASIVVLDHKPSLFFLNSLLAKASRLIDSDTESPVYDVRILNPQAHGYSHVFNPLQQTAWKRMTSLQRTELLLDSFDIRIVEGSDTAFFAAISELVTTAYLDWHRGIESFREIARLMDDREVYKGMNGYANDWPHARHPLVFLKRLASCPAVTNVPNSADQCIDVDEILTGKKPMLVYCFLPTLEDARISQSISRFMFKLLLHSASVLLAENSKRPVIVIADEAQHLYGPAFVQALEVAREFGISFWAFNQSRSQLITAAGDFRDTLDSCIGAQMMLTTRNLTDIEYIEQTSPERMYHTLKWSQFRQPGDSLDSSAFHPDWAVLDGLTGQQSIDVSEQLRPFPERNRLLAVSVHEQGGLVRLMRNEGLWAFNGAWVPFRWHRHVSKATYDQLSNEWPEPLPGMVPNTPPVSIGPASVISATTAPGLLDSVSTSTPPSELSAALSALAHKLEKK